MLSAWCFEVYFTLHVRLYAYRTLLKFLNFSLACRPFEKVWLWQKVWPQHESYNDIIDLLVWLCVFLLKSTSLYFVLLCTPYNFLPWLWVFGLVQWLKFYHKARATAKKWAFNIDYNGNQLYSHCILEKATC